MSRQNEGKLESNGVCSLCGGTFGKRAMTKHLTSCVKEKTNAEMSSSKQKPKSGKLFHLVAEAVSINKGIKSGVLVLAE